MESQLPEVNEYKYNYTLVGNCGYPVRIWSEVDICMVYNKFFCCF